MIYFYKPEPVSGIIRAYGRRFHFVAFPLLLLTVFAYFRQVCKKYPFVV